MKNIDSGKITYFSISTLMVLLFLFFSYTRVFDEFEYSMLDFRYRIRPPRKVMEDIVIIEVSDDSIEKIGKWPFPRGYHALLVQALKSAGVKTVIFDIFFSEKKEGDKEFAANVKESGNVYIPYVFELDRSNPDKSVTHAKDYAAPLISVLKLPAEGTGFVNVTPDMDGKIRRVPLFIEYKGKYYPQITFNAIINGLGYTFDDVIIYPGKKVILGDEFSLPLDERSSFIVNYPAKWGKAFRHYSYVDILQSYLSGITGKEPSVDLKKLKDTVCFIGLTATASPDAHPSPMEPLYPGIGVHTSVYDSILRHNYVRRFSRGINLLILVLLWVLTAFVTSKSQKRHSSLFFLLLIALFLIVAFVLFWPFGIWIDMFYPLVSMVTVYGVFSFKKYIMETQKRELLEKELNIAKDIQMSFLPNDIPDLGGMDICVKMLTARQVGGDLYDIIELGEGKMGIMLGDVSGKGVPAALYMARVVSVFRTFAREGTTAEVLEKINNRLISVGTSNLFVTLTYMVFDTKDKTTTFSIGGHMPTVMVTPDGDVEMLDATAGMPLGMIESEFSQEEKKFEPGSIFVLYSDGVTEAMNIREEMFGQEKLNELVRDHRGMSTEKIVDLVQKAVADYAGKAKQHDDITVMVIKT